MAAHALHSRFALRVDRPLVAWVGLALVAAFLFVFGLEIAHALAPVGGRTEPVRLIAPQ